MSSKSICIIPARGGSKRIHNKNVKPFLGKPILNYVVDIAIKSNLFTDIIVSTDSHSIAEAALSAGASVPFMRSEKNSDDHATTAAVLDEVLYQSNIKNLDIDFCCCLYPTAVLLNAKYLHQALEILMHTEAKTVMPVLNIGSKFWRSYKLEENKLRMNFNEYIHSRSQDLPDLFVDAGQFYFFKINAFREIGNMINDSIYPIVLDELQVQDIDTEMDWTLAEMKYQHLYN